MPNVKLGKLATVLDGRTIRARRVQLPIDLPESYNVDDTHPGVPTPMFRNDILGDCVIAARAHHTLRFGLEHGPMPRITDDEVAHQYFHETGGPDAGLVMLYSLKAWRKEGWLAGGKMDRIHAFVALRAWDIKWAIYTLGGAHLGCELPIAASDQFDRGQPWVVEDWGTPRGRPGSWGGHAIYAYAWEPGWTWCVTWGKRQKMSDEWLTTYCSEAYGVIDSTEVPERPEHTHHLGINMVAVGEYLERVGTL